MSLRPSQTVASEPLTTSGNQASITGTISGTTLTVTAVSSGTVVSGAMLVGKGVTAGTMVIGKGTGTGGAGTYSINISQSIGTSQAFSLAGDGGSQIPLFDSGTGTVNGCATLVPRTNIDPRIWGAYPDGQVVSTTVTINTSTGEVDTSEALFNASTDVGKLIAIPDGGSSGGTYYGTIQSVSSATKIFVVAPYPSHNPASVQRITWGHDNALFINAALSYATGLSGQGSYTNVDLAGLTYGIGSTVTVNGPSVNFVYNSSPTAVNANFVSGVGLVNGSLLALPPFTPPSVTPTDALPMVIVQDGNYHATIRDLFLQANYVANGLLVIPGGGLAKTYIDNLRVERYFNPNMADEEAYDPNYLQTFTRLYYDNSQLSNGQFRTGDTVIGSVSRATGTIYNSGNGELTLSNVSGSFSTSSSEVITASSSPSASAPTVSPNNRNQAPPPASITNIYSFTISLPPGPQYNPYRPYGLRCGSQSTASPTSISSSQLVIVSADLKQFMPEDANYGTELTHTGIGAWFACADAKVLSLIASGNRKGVVVDGFTNNFNNIHAFPLQSSNPNAPGIHEWIDIEVNNGNNTFINTYEDHGYIWENDPRNIFEGGRMVNIARPQTQISSGFVIASPNTFTQPVNLGAAGPLSITGDWLKINGPGTNSGIPSFLKYWQPYVAYGASIDTSGNMTVSSLAAGSAPLGVNQAVVGGGLPSTSGTFINTQTSGTPGGVGTYTVSPSPMSAVTNQNLTGGYFFQSPSPLYPTGNQGIYSSAALDINRIGSGATDRTVANIQGGATTGATIGFTDALTTPGALNEWGSLGDCGLLRTGSVPVQMCAGSGNPNGVVTASPPAVYFNSAGGSMNTLYLKQSGANSNTGWSAVSTTPALILGNTNGQQQATGTTMYYIPTGQSTGNTVLNSVAKSVLPINGMAGNLQVVSVAPGAGQSYTITLYGVNSPTSLTCTISGTANSCSDTTHFPAFATGEDIALQIVSTSGAAPSIFRWGLTFQTQ